MTNPRKGVFLVLNKGYGLMPNVVLFDEKLSPSAKLLFVYISSLCAVEGYCWASNKHLADRFGISQSQVSRLIAELSNYLVISKGTSKYRTIKLQMTNLPTQKAQGNLRKNAYHNITSGIKKLNKEKNAVKYKNLDELGMPDLSSDYYDEYYKRRGEQT